MRLTHQILSLLRVSLTLLDALLLSDAIATIDYLLVQFCICRKRGIIALDGSVRND